MQRIKKRKPGTKLSFKRRLLAAVVLAAPLSAAGPLALIPALSGCDYLIPSHQPASTAATSPQRPVTSTTSGSPGHSDGQSGSEWGWVSCAADSEYQEFNRQVRQFLSTSIDPNNLPAIGCMHNHGGGRVLFKGSIAFEGGTAMNSSNPASALRVSAASWIEIHIDTADRSKKTQAAAQVQPIKLSAAATNAGDVDGRAAVLNFQDDKGEVRLEGRIDGGKFKGQFIYKNYTRWNGGNTGYEGTMGIFSIRACRFFFCG